METKGSLSTTKETIAKATKETMATTMDLMKIGDNHGPELKCRQKRCCKNHIHKVNDHNTNNNKNTNNSNNNNNNSSSSSSDISSPNTTTEGEQLYRRNLPESCIPFSSDAGKKMFTESLLSGFANIYFPLAEQFRTQDEPAYCGLSTLVMVLNALAVSTPFL